MNRVKSTGNFKKGRRGLAQIVKLSDENMRVDFAPTDKEATESFNIKVVYGEKGTVPEYLPFKKMKVNGKLGVSATMNVEGDAVLFAVPASGEYEARFNKMVAPEGQEPVSETKQGKKGTYKQFATLIEITDGPWKGTNYWKPFYPNFGKDEAGNLAVAGSGSGSDALFDFLDCTQVVNHTIPFSENPLPEIQTIAQKEDARFKIIVQKGWIDMLVKPLEDGDAFEDVVDTEFKAPVEEATEKIHPALND